MTAFLVQPNFAAIQENFFPCINALAMKASASGVHLKFFMPCSSIFKPFCVSRMRMRVAIKGAAISAMETRLNTVRKRRVKPF